MVNIHRWNKCLVQNGVSVVTDQDFQTKTMLDTTLFDKPGVSLYVAQSKIHGHGCFSASRISPGAIIGEFVGERIDLKEALRRNDKCSDLYSDYILEVEDDLFIDGAKWNNPIRFINHGCEPNCEVIVVKRRAFFKAITTISAGDEVTLDYCFDADVREPCACGARSCKGFI